jgi:hypothetical protein
VAKLSFLQISIVLRRPYQQEVVVDMSIAKVVIAGTITVLQRMVFNPWLRIEQPLQHLQTCLMELQIKAQSGILETFII